MAIIIVPPSKEESCYSYRVVSDGLPHGAWLTYELFPNKPDDRGLLLIHGAPELLEPEERKSYNYLLEELKGDMGNFGRTKSIVNQIADGRIQLKDVKIAVHKFGPVPVVVSNRPITVDHEVAPGRKRELDVRIAVYPLIPPISTKRPQSSMPEFMNSELQFVNSLHLGFGKMMQRYLEDVGEDLYDIEHNLGLRSVLRRAKNAEVTLTASIKSKLNKALVYSGQLQLWREGRLSDPSLESACRLFEENRDWVVAAVYARACTFLMINELYERLGISSRSSHYLQTLNELKGDFDSRVHPGYYEESVGKRLSDLSLLRNAIAEYRGGGPVKTREDEASTLWGRRILGFVRFVDSIRSSCQVLALTPETPRIFISHHHDVPEAEVLKRQLVKWISDSGVGNPKMLFFKSAPNPPIRESIRQLIWLADTLHAIVPKETKVHQEQTEKSYDWVAIEAEHALLLGKRLLYFVEEGTTVEDVVRSFQNLSSDFLSPFARLSRETRLQALLESLRDRVFARFRVDPSDSDANMLDKNITEVLRKEIENTISHRCVEIVSGLLQQFPREVQQTIARIQVLVPHPKKETRSWVASHLYQEWKGSYKDIKHAQRSITNAWRAVDKRTMYLGGTQYRLITLLHRRYYSGSIEELIRVLTPGFSDMQVSQIQTRILTEHLG